MQIDKKELIQNILHHLADELRTLVTAAKAAHEAATNEASKPEDQYDTRGLEASYLAGAQAQRAAEIERVMMVYKFLPVREYTAADLIGPGALVELELNQKCSLYYLVPSGGGLITQMNGKPIQVVTAQSPIGDAMLGQKVGGTFTVESRGGDREYSVVSIQ